MIDKEIERRIQTGRQSVTYIHRRNTGTRRQTSSVTDRKKVMQSLCLLMDRIQNVFIIYENKYFPEMGEMVLIEGIF